VYDDLRMTSQPWGSAPVQPDFSGTVELPCIIDVGETLKRFIPMFIVSFLFFGLVGTFVVAMAFHDPVPVVSYSCGVVVGALVVTAMSFSMKKRLTVTYGTRQRLWLSPQGLHRTDGTVATWMPWSGVQGFVTMNSAIQTSRTTTGNAAGLGTNTALNAAQKVIAEGIVGSATLQKQPTAVRRQLAVHARHSGPHHCGLPRGDAVPSDRALIFPGEFEQNWRAGTVGAWMRHYRPDLGV